MSILNIVITLIFALFIIKLLSGLETEVSVFIRGVLSLVFIVQDLVLSFILTYLLFVYIFKVTSITVTAGVLSFLCLFTIFGAIIELRKCTKRDKLYKLQFLLNYVYIIIDTLFIYHLFKTFSTHSSIGWNIFYIGCGYTISSIIRTLYQKQIYAFYH